MSIELHFLSHSPPSLQLPNSLFYIMSDAGNPTDDGSGVPKIVSLAANAYSEKNSLTIEAGTLTFVGEYYEKKKKSDFTNNDDISRIAWEKSREASGTLTFYEGAGFASGDDAVFKATKVKHSAVNNEDVTIIFTGFTQVNEQLVSYWCIVAC